MKQVVIVGAGVSVILLLCHVHTHTNPFSFPHVSKFGGSILAKFLDENCTKDFQVTLISPREDFFLYKVSGLRLATTTDGDEKGWEQRTMIPLSKLLAKHPNKNKFIRDTVVSVDHSARLVTLKSSPSEPLHYDVLVICSGSRNFSPGEPPATVTSKQDTIAYYASFREAASKAKRITVLGSGATGLELCGEIRQYLPQVELTCITRSARILDGGATNPMPQSFVRSVERKLDRLKVQVIVQDEVVSESFTETLPWVVPRECKVELKSGKMLECDLFVSAVGFQYNTGFLPDQWLDIKTKQVLVNEYGQVAGEDNVFCFGDAAKSGAAKLGYLASENAALVGKNVLRVLRSRKPRHQLLKSGKGFVLPLGDRMGRSTVYGIQFDDWITSLAKGRGLFTWHHWNAWGHPTNQLPELENGVGLVRHAVGLPFGVNKRRIQKKKKKQ